MCLESFSNSWIANNCAASQIVGFPVRRLQEIGWTSENRIIILLPLLLTLSGVAAVAAVVEGVGRIALSIPVGIVSLLSCDRHLRREWQRIGYSLLRSAIQITPWKRDRNEAVFRESDLRIVLVFFNILLLLPIAIACSPCVCISIIKNGLSLSTEEPRELPVARVTPSYNEPSDPISSLSEPELREMPARLLAERIEAEHTDVSALPEWVQLKYRAYLLEHSA